MQLPLLDFAHPYPSAPTSIPHESRLSSREASTSFQNTMNRAHCPHFQSLHCSSTKNTLRHLLYGEFGHLGELAELPEEELITRLGQQARAWLQLSRGNSEHTFQPIEARFELKEHIEFETHVEQMDSLLFIGANMINNLVTRASGRALSLATLTVHMSLEKSITYERVIRPAIPSNDRMFLLKLLQLEIAAHPPIAAIVSLTMTAEAGQQCKVQLGLFAPQTPEPSRLDVTLARLKAFVGDDRVGSPALKDSHRSGSFSMETFHNHRMRFSF